MSAAIAADPPRIERGTNPQSQTIGKRACPNAPGGLVWVPYSDPCPGSDEAKPGSGQGAVSDQGRERQQRVDEESLRQAREAEKREDAAKIADGPALARRFQPVFDEVRVDEYRGFLDQFYLMTKPSVKVFVIGSSQSNDNLGQAYRSDPEFWGALFLRMGLAYLEDAEVHRSQPDAGAGLDYLFRARDLGFADAYDLLDQMSTLGLDWIVPKQWSGRFAEAVRKWRESGATGTRPALKLSAPLNLAERRKAMAPYLSAARQREAVEEARIETAKRAADAARARIRLSPEAVRLIQQQDALISKALTRSAKYASGFFSSSFDPAAALPRDQVVSLLTEARAALVQIERQWSEQLGSRRAGKGLTGLRQASASEDCTAPNPSACASLVRLLDAVSYQDEPPKGFGDARDKLALVACHTEHDALSCSMTGSDALARGRYPDGEKTAAKALGYFALACGAEKAVVPQGSPCSAAGLCLLKGRCGPQEIDLAADFFELACAHEAARDCNTWRREVQRARQQANR